MHDERVDRHCAGIEESNEKLKKKFDVTQQTLNDMNNQNKQEVSDLEIEFLNASKSSK